MSLDGDNNDLVISAAENGADWNGVEVRLINGAASGDEATATYDPVARRLNIDIDPGRTTAHAVVDAVNATGLFTAQLDDQTEASSSGAGVVDVASGFFLTGGSGATLDRSSGVQIVNRGQTQVVTFENAATVEDLLNALNYSGAGVLAAINDAGTGIDVRSVVSGCDFSIGENGGATATQLGIRSSTASTRLTLLNFGDGVEDASGTDFVIQRKDGASLDIDVSSAESLGDILDLINEHANNGDHALVARLAEFGNGIELSDYSVGAASLTITRTAGSAAWDLGLIPVNEESATGTAVVTPDGPADRIQGRDTAVLETQGVFTSLIRLDDAIAAEDLHQIERALDMLEEDFNRLNFARSDLGARGQVLDAISDRLSTEDTELRQALSEEVDTDMVEAISDLVARQANIEASLQLIGRTVDLTLLNYL